MKSDYEIAKMHKYILRQVSRLRWSHSKSYRWKTKGRLISLEWLNGEGEKKKTEVEIRARLSELKEKLKVPYIFPTMKYRIKGEISELEWVLK